MAVGRGPQVNRGALLNRWVSKNMGYLVSRGGVEILGTVQKTSKLETMEEEVQSMEGTMEEVQGTLETMGEEVKNTVETTVAEVETVTVEIGRRRGRG